jgi:hypothetical protein
MTIRKADNLLRGDRTPAYVDRETGAAELRISPDTWDQWVKEGRLPPSCPTFPESTPRWRWEDVDRKLSGKVASDTTDMMMQAALKFGQKSRRAIADTSSADYIAGANVIAKKKVGRPRTRRIFPEGPV